MSMWHYVNIRQRNVKSLVQIFANTCQTFGTNIIKFSFKTRESSRKRRIKECYQFWSSWSFSFFLNLLDFFLRALRALRLCDPLNDAVIRKSPVGKKLPWNLETRNSHQFFLQSLKDTKDRKDTKIANYKNKKQKYKKFEVSVCVALLWSLHQRR